VEDWNKISESHPEPKSTQSGSKTLI
jgi:hypothetical protein